MEIKAQQTGDDFDIQLREDSELLQFSLQLASPCPHCSMKAQVALFGSKLMCLEGAHVTGDQRFMDPRYILSGAVLALEGLDEEEAEDELAAQNESTAPAGSHVH